MSEDPALDTFVISPQNTNSPKSQDVEEFENSDFDESLDEIIEPLSKHRSPALELVPVKAPKQEPDPLIVTISGDPCTCSLAGFLNKDQPVLLRLPSGHHLEPSRGWLYDSKMKSNGRLKPPLNLVTPFQRGCLKSLIF